MGVNQNLLKLAIQMRLYSSAKTYLLCFIFSEKEVAMVKVEVAVVKVDPPFNLHARFGRLRLCGNYVIIIEHGHTYKILPTPLQILYTWMAAFNPRACWLHYY